MGRVIAIVLVAAVVVAGAWFVAGVDGSVTAEIGDTTITLATPVAVLALTLGFVALYAVVRFFALLAGAPGALGRRRANRRRRQGDVAVTRTLLALAAGDSGDSRREAAKARKLLGDTPQTLLLAAEAGRLGGRESEAEAAFRLLTEREDAAFLGYRGLLRQAMDRGDWDEAARLARDAEAAHPGAAWLRNERGQLAIRTGAWAEALALTDSDGPRAALATAAADAETDPRQALKYAKQAWDEQPGPPSALAYARRLREAGKEGRAQEVLRQAWARGPHPDIAAMALATAGDDPQARLKAARRLAQEKPGDAESHFLIAEAARDAGELADARTQVDAAEQAGMTDRRLWSLRALIDEADPEASRDALRKAAVAPPEPGWRCSTCGTPQVAWRPACPSCNNIGTIGWGRAIAAGPMIAHAP